MAPRFRRVHRGDVGGREEILESGGRLRNQPIVAMDDVGAPISLEGDPRSGQCAVEAEHPGHEIGLIQCHQRSILRNAHDAYTANPLFTGKITRTLGEDDDIMTTLRLMFGQGMDMAAESAVHDRRILPGTMQDAHYGFTPVTQTL